MRLRLVDRHRHAERVPGADDAPDLHLVVQRPGRPVDRHVCLRVLDLPARPAHRRSARHDRRGAPVVADRHPLVVRQQRVVRPEHAADVGGVMHRGVEVGVVADGGGKQKLGVAHGDQDPVAEPAVDAIRGGVAGEERARLPSDGTPGLPAEPQQRVERGGGEGGARAVGGTREPALVVAGGQVEDLVADRHPHARQVVLVIAAAEDAEGKILDREVRAALGRLDPGGAGGVVGLVHGEAPRLGTFSLRMTSGRGAR